MWVGAVVVLQFLLPSSRGVELEWSCVAVLMSQSNWQVRLFFFIGCAQPGCCFFNIIGSSPAWLFKKNMYFPRSFFMFSIVPSRIQNDLERCFFLPSHSLTMHHHWLQITTRKWAIGPDQKYHLLFHPVLIRASVPGATRAGTF